MIWLLRFAFGDVLITMLCVSSGVSALVPLRRLAIPALGNIAMSAYMPLSPWRLPANASIDRLLLRREA
ncbi:MAG: hypothetical protein ACLQFF_05300 [Steroidobacteraceae bacterium]|jgi:hypothetical protein